MSTTVEIHLPDIGDFKDVPVIEVHVQPGSKINVDDPLITLETDKATHGRSGDGGRHGWRGQGSRPATGSPKEI